MDVPIWVTIISDIVCAVITGVFGFFGGKAYYKKQISKKTNKIVQKQKAGNDSQQTQIGGDLHVK